MKHAIDILRTSAQALTLSAELHREEGFNTLAAISEEVAADYREAIIILERAEPWNGAPNPSTD